MKTHIHAAVLLLGSSGFVYAADAVVEDVVIVEGAYNWSGAYVGVQGGYARGDADFYFDFDPLGSGPQIEYAPKGFFGGGYLGYNHQLDNRMVLGVEADIAAGDVSESDAAYVGPVLGVAELEYTISARGRLGYAVGRFLPYATAGVSVGRFYHGLEFPSGTEEGLTANYVGWTVGAGAEYAVTDNLIARIDYRYTDFGTENFDSYDTGNGGIAAHSVSLRTNDIRLGIAYKF